MLFGVSLVSQVALALDTNKYHGGSHDGYAMGTSAMVVWLADNNKYHGGSYDGYGMETSSPRVLTFLDTSKYQGGSYDGYVMIASASDISLPVRLSSFTATASDGNVILKWRTETEVNNIGFGIYRSEGTTGEDDSRAATTSGKYTKIGFVSGAGNTAMPRDYQFVDKKAEAGITYFYYLEDIDIAGEKNRSDIIKVVVPPAEAIPTVFGLFQNYPNPFNPETWIPYDLASSGPVVISIYNTKGQLVQELNLGNQKAGSYITKSKSAYWDGRNEHGEKAASGVYLYRLRAGKFEATRRMVILK